MTNFAYIESFVFVIMIILTFHKGKAYSKPIQRRQYVVFCNLKTICCYHAIWATMENCFSSSAKNCPYPKNTNSSLNGHIFHPQQYDFWGKSRMFQRNNKILICMRHESYSVWSDAGFAWLIKKLLYLSIQDWYSWRWHKAYVRHAQYTWDLWITNLSYMGNL